MAAEILIQSEIPEGNVTFWVAAFLFFVGWSLAGKWILLHPDRVFPEGLFTGPSSLGARIARFETTLVAMFMVFSGALGAIFYVVLLTHLPESLGPSAGIVGACYVTLRVRKTVQQSTKERAIQPPH
jgi:hypothetical protein